MERSIQDQVVPEGICFGCGPSNPQGLHLRSFPWEEGVRAQWQPSSHHAAFAGVVCAGIVGTLLDCHGTAAVLLAIKMRDGLWPVREGPPWVTATYTLELMRPTPTDGEVALFARCVELLEDQATVEAVLESQSKERARLKGIWKRRRR